MGQDTAVPVVPDLDKLIEELRAPGVWASIGDLQADLLVALGWAQEKLALAADMGDEVRRMSEGVRSGALIPGMLVRAERARVAFDGVVVRARVVPAAVEDAPDVVLYSTAPTMPRAENQGESVITHKRKGKKNEREKVQGAA